MGPAPTPSFTHHSLCKYCAMSLCGTAIPRRSCCTWPLDGIASGPDPLSPVQPGQRAGFLTGQGTLHAAGTHQPSAPPGALLGAAMRGGRMGAGRAAPDRMCHLIINQSLPQTNQFCLNTESQAGSTRHRGTPGAEPSQPPTSRIPRPWELVMSPKGCPAQGPVASLAAESL